MPLTRLAAKNRALAAQTTTISEPAPPVRQRSKPRAPAAETITVGGGTLARLANKIRTRSETVVIGENLARLSTKMRALAVQTTTIGGGTLALQKGKLRTIIEYVRATDKKLESNQTYDNFQAGTYSFTEGGNSPNGLWTNMFLGGTGAASGSRFTASISSNVMWLKPQASTSPGETHATENKSTTTWEDFDLIFKMRTISQLRTGSAPNAWETAWIIFRYTDDWHHYYFTIKTSGCELGRKDYFPHDEQQMFLATPGSPAVSLGTWDTVRLRAFGNHITVWIDNILDSDTPIIDVYDNGTFGYDSQTGLLPPPPTAALYSGSINPYVEDAEGEFDDFVMTANTGPQVTRLTAKTRALAAETIVSNGGTLARLAAKIRALTTQTTTIGGGTLALQKGKLRTLAAQTVTVTGGTLARLAAKTRTRTENVVISETLARLTAKIRALATQITTVAAGTATATKTTGAQNITRALPTETITIGESLARLAAKIRALSTQIVTISETPNRSAGKSRALLTQIVTLSDILNRTVGIAGAVTRSITQTITIGESVSRLTAKTRALSTQITTISENVAKITGTVRAVPAQTVTVGGGTLVRQTQKIRTLLQSTPIQEILRAFKNGIELIAPQRPDKGGFTLPLEPKRFRKRLLRTTIRYPVYHVTERELFRRRKKVRETIKPVIIPAYMQNIHKVAAPFIVLDPVKNTVNVRFAVKNAQDRVYFAGKYVPVLVPARKKQKEVHKASQEIVMQQGTIRKYGKRLHKLQKLMKLALLAKDMP